ncbi:MAG: BatA domain-containing protein [Sphingobacteriaceae bacterium]|nr:BatA domain-containing protein [Sphingobacteriaceae bacterium]
MHFLYPISLFALAGIIVPLIIHLWNVKQGKTIKIGSIALLGESSSASSKSFKINDWLLFVLRCLLLVLLAFLLARPYLKRTITGSNKNGWILVDKNIFPQVFKTHQKTIDSLLKKGYEMHDFNIDFKPLTLKDTLNNETKQVNTLNYSALFSAANQFLAPGAKVYFFANQRLNRFGNEIPTVNYALNWIPLKQSDTLSNWIATYAGKKYEAKSNPSSTTYQALNSSDREPISIVIYENPGATDRKYLIAALKAIESFTGRKMIINGAAEKANIGFWLSDSPVSADFSSSIASDGSLFQYENGKLVTSASFINLYGHQIKLSKRTEANHDAEKIWTDGFGNAILTRDKTHNLNIFHFYSRFNPQWNELIWDGLFVKALMPIVIGDKDPHDFGFEDNAADQRTVSIKQKAVIEANKTVSVTKTTQNKPIGTVIWVAAFLIFGAERILSFRKKANNVKN